MTELEIFGAIASVLYLLLEIKQYKLMWIVGAVSSAVYAVVFGIEGLYASMALQCYYFCISFYGWSEWKKNKKGLSEKKEIFLKKMTWTVLLLSTLAFAVIWGLLGFLLKNYTNDPSPITDSLVMALSVVATYWLTKSYIEQWLLWIVANGIAIGLYFTQELYATAILYVIYTIGAVYGYIHWSRKGKLL